MHIKKHIEYTEFLVLVKQAFKFGLVGILNTLITLAAIFVLMNIFSVSYVIANAVGYVLGFINSFVLNKTWTFQSKGAVKKESLLFIAVFAATYSLQLGLLVCLKEIFKMDARLAQIVSMIFYTGISFIGNKLFTFKK